MSSADLETGELAWLVFFFICITTLLSPKEAAVLAATRAYFHVGFFCRGSGCHEIA